MTRYTARRDTFVYWRYVALWQIIAWLPARVAARLPRLLGNLWWRFGSDTQRDQVRRNLSRIIGHTDEANRERLVQAAYHSYVRYWVESFRLHRTRLDSIAPRVNDRGVAHLDAVTRAGGGAVFITGHLGSWEIGAGFCTARGLHLVAVAEEVKPRRLFDRFVALRQAAGIAVLPLRRGTDILTPLAHAMGEQSALATLLADRDLTRGGPIVSFFGEPCRLPAGAAALAVRTGRPIVAGAFFTAGDRYDGVVRPPFAPASTDLYDITQQVAYELEELIRHAPEQWHVFVPNWLRDREPQHPVAIAWRDGENWQELARAEFERKRRRL